MSEPPEGPELVTFRQAKIRYYIAEGFTIGDATLNSLADVLMWQAERDETTPPPEDGQPPGSGAPGSGGAG